MPKHLSTEYRSINMLLLLSLGYAIHTHTHTHILLHSSKTPQGCSLDQETFLSLPQNIHIFFPTCSPKI
uniref:Putative secreted protein n=1 Tax=Ixodes ricinus TaxID=34613 RepID=A0A147BT26_IXORI